MANYMFAMTGNRTSIRGVIFPEVKKVKVGEKVEILKGDWRGLVGTYVGSKPTAPISTLDIIEVEIFGIKMQLKFSDYKCDFSWFKTC